MSKIRVMSESLANKIAAGEVVEKCASIVKELVENAIDANALNIKVNLIDGGLTSISVIDDGIGMDKEDAVMSFSRHATSKIYKDDDLYFIETLGFRGEALASIASVSEVDLETCSSDLGTRVHIKGGNIDLVEPASARVGTSFTVTNLFYNTPARLKYLKSESTELNNCIQFIEKLSLSRPDIAFTLTNNGKVIIKTSGKDNLLKTIHEIYGYEVSSNMLKINANNDDFVISGYICKPGVLKKNRYHFNTILNGRVVRNNEINKAINDAYYTYKHEGFYPIVVINIETDPTLVDVNIHPTKQDVKLSKINELCKMLYDEIKNTLYDNLLIPDALSNTIKEEVKIEVKKEEKREEKVEQISFDLSNVRKEKKERNQEFKALKMYPIGQVHGTYIVAENEEGMFLIDQHAAHERINYEMLKEKFKEEKTMVTNMLIPLSIELTASDYNIFMDSKSILEELGFIIEEFGINTVVFKGHPTWLTKNYEDDNLKTIVDLVITNHKNFNKDRFLDHLAKMMSCKMSIKANEHLSLEKMEKLLDDLVKCDNPYNCCHGRPSIIKFNNYELEKMFKRVIN